MGRFLEFKPTSPSNRTRSHFSSKRNKYITYPHDSRDARRLSAWMVPKPQMLQLPEATVDGGVVLRSPSQCKTQELQGSFGNKAVISWMTIMWLQIFNIRDHETPGFHVFIRGKASWRSSVQEMGDRAREYRFPAKRDLNPAPPLAFTTWFSPVRYFSIRKFQLLI